MRPPGHIGLASITLATAALWLTTAVASAQQAGAPALPAPGSVASQAARAVKAAGSQAGSSSSVVSTAVQSAQQSAPQSASSAVRSATSSLNPQPNVAKVSAPAAPKTSDVHAAAAPQVARRQAQAPLPQAPLPETPAVVQALVAPLSASPAPVLEAIAARQPQAASEGMQSADADVDAAAQQHVAELSSALVIDLDDVAAQTPQVPDASAAAHVPDVSAPAHVPDVSAEAEPVPDLTEPLIEPVSQLVGGVEGFAEYATQVATAAPNDLRAPRLEPTSAWLAQVQDDVTPLAEEGDIALAAVGTLAEDQQLAALVPAADHEPLLLAQQDQVAALEPAAVAAPEPAAVAVIEPAAIAPMREVLAIHDRAPLEARRGIATGQLPSREPLLPVGSVKNAGDEAVRSSINQSLATRPRTNEAASFPPAWLGMSPDAQTRAYPSSAANDRFWERIQPRAPQWVPASGVSTVPGQNPASPLVQPTRHWQSPDGSGPRQLPGGPGAAQVPDGVGPAPAPSTAPATTLLSQGLSSGSAAPLLPALSLLAAWRALWRAAALRPNGICLPNLAPPG